MKKTSLILILAACANAQAADLPVVIDNSSYPASTDVPINSVASSSTSAVYELMQRIEQMQSDVQQLTGKVDEQAFLIEELKKRQSKLYSDFDERLQSIENKGASSAQATPSAAPEAATAGQEQSAAPVTPSTEVAPAAKSTPANEAPVESAPLTPKVSATSTEVSAPEKQDYSTAYNELRTGHTLQSIEQFKAFLSKYPNSLYANNAQYWLAEAYRVQHNNDAAFQAFVDVVEKYPNGAKVPDALLRLGMMEMEKNNTVKAREYFTRIASQFPKSQVAPIAEKKMLKLDEVKN